MNGILRTLTPIALGLFVGVAVTMNLARFYALDSAPRGFFYDEAGSANHAICMAQSAIDSAHFATLPMFFISEADAVHSAPYIYTAAIWTKLFGYGPAAFRALAALSTALTILGVFIFARDLFGERAALYAVVSASLSPWAFQFSRIAWDDPFYPMFLLFGIRLLWIAKRPGQSMWAAIFLSLACYTYAPSRLVVPLLVALVLSIRLYRRSLTWALILPFAVVLAFSLWSLASEMIYGPVNDRAKSISLYAVYASSGVGAAAVLFARQFVEHFTPAFLLFQGDHNFRHSTQRFGELSWFDVFALLGYLALLSETIWKRGSNGSIALLLFVPAAAIVALLPSPMTIEGVPHALRAIATWPFIAIASGAGMAWLHERSRLFVIAGACIAATFAFKFLVTFFLIYPLESEHAFSINAQRALSGLDRAGLLREADTWRGRYPYARYYAMNAGVTCRELGPSGSPGGNSAVPPLLLQLGITSLAALVGSWLGRFLERRQ